MTALYETVPVGVSSPRGVDPLKYQTRPTESEYPNDTELLTVKLRYKSPEGRTSKLGVRVGPVTRQAAVGKNWTDVTVELDLLGGSISASPQPTASNSTQLHLSFTRWILTSGFGARKRVL